MRSTILYSKLKLQYLEFRFYTVPRFNQQQHPDQKYRSENSTLFKKKSIRLYGVDNRQRNSQTCIVWSQQHESTAALPPFRFIFGQIIFETLILIKTVCLNTYWYSLKLTVAFACCHQQPRCLTKHLLHWNVLESDTGSLPAAGLLSSNSAWPLMSQRRDELK